MISLINCCEQNIVAKPVNLKLAIELLLDPHSHPSNPQRARRNISHFNSLHLLMCFIASANRLAIS
ncbi:rCG58534 [Rattus norvegicus]|uniref:RCG58534 n=1 Tax=Rattus norvegicus TaxID=10116 RepID=A6K6X6_RAT|nr:rCG58534 [Rattus norvegicus]